MTRHQYGISALVSQTSFFGETSGGVANVGCFLRLGKGFLAKRTNSISLHFSRHFAPRFLGFLREGIFLYRDVKKTVRKTSQELVINVYEGLTIPDWKPVVSPRKKSSSIHIST